MEFEDFEQWLSENLADFREFPTLGGREHFSAKYTGEDGSITVKYGKKKRIKTLKHDAIERIFTRCKAANVSDRYKSSYYQLPPSKEKFRKAEYSTEYWADPPDKIATPYIPAVIKYWNNNL